MFRFAEIQFKAMQILTLRAGQMAKSFKFLMILTLLFVSVAHADVVESGGFNYQTGMQAVWVVQEDFPKTWPTDFASKDPFRIWRLDEQVSATWGEYTDYAWQATTSSAVESAAQYSTSTNGN